jgi:hypothetical protein
MDFPWVHIKNLASKALSLAAEQICADWPERYGYAPVLLETFVELGRYRGTCYRAANWIRVGVTRERDGWAVTVPTARYLERSTCIR